MKAKITSFIMTLLTIFTIALIGIIGFLIYNEITGSSLVSEVEDFCIKYYCFNRWIR